MRHAAPIYYYISSTTSHIDHTYRGTILHCTMAAASCGKRKPIYKVVLLGNLGVGKTSIFRRLRDGSFHEHRTNFIGVDKHMKSYVLSNGEAVFVSSLQL